MSNPGSEGKVIASFICYLFLWLYMGEVEVDIQIIRK